ncbi:TonB-dependent receptor [Marinicauda algicola]|uniref:TonB-dependent receptor n=2 Tax=Marinicauda algicola TaxID=2029849 RepID=A0A4S2GWA4_9PROT|nr:TonB-dependent receptor [Marinicauda algicola]
MALGTAALAQEAEEEQEAEETRSGDVVVVTGIRMSLESAQDIKREADTFVDAITAEDIGALADRSVAEALQRVPGVNVGRFQKTSDPDRFSVEGAGVIVRGLPFVRSELNGRDVFSAAGGRELSFNDVSPELLGRIEVFKNATADMIDGGIAGTVNLVTRNPLDNPGPQLAGTVEANYGDLAEEWSPAFSVLGSNTWETGAGTFGFQLGYAQSELITRTDASQVTDPCYRTAALDDRCIRVNPVSSGGVGDPVFTPGAFPPAGTVLTPKGAGVRTTGFDRDREAISAVGQWESNDGRILVTLEYLRAEADLQLDEYAILALVNDDALFPTPAPGTSLTFDENGLFQFGVLSQNAGSGIPTELLRFNQKRHSVTEDIALDIDWAPTDRLRFNFELQRIEATRDSDSIISAMQTASDIYLDVRPETPVVEFRPPSAGAGGSDYFTDPDGTFYWFLLDNQIRNTGELDSFRADAEYDFEEGGFLRSARFGARWGERRRVTRDANFANWGNLSAPWLGSAQYARDFPGSSGVRNPFADFQRGEVPIPVPGGAAIFFGSDDPVADYLSGATYDQSTAITVAWENSFPFFWDRPNWGPFPTTWRPISARGGVVDGTQFLPGEISDVGEETMAFYGRADFGHDDLFGNGWVLEGNIGLRYVETTIQSDGQISFPSGPAPDILTFCDPLLNPGASLPGYCSLSPARQAEFLAAFTGETIEDDGDIEFENWLPSLNATLEVREGMLFRLGVSKAISRPDLGAFRTGGALFDNTGDLRAAGTLETGPLFQVFTGNRLLEPIESTNYDLAFEWYFDDVGSLTFSLFQKDLSGLISLGTTEREFTSSSGVTIVGEVNGPANVDDGTLRGFELAYQDVYEFLPGPLSNLGTQLTYTYVDAGELSNPTNFVARSAFASGLPLAGVSENTINAVVFYEDDRYAARLAYNWRSEYLLTPRDDIFPFNPIFGEDTGQLDGSFFYTVNDHFKVGVQGVNLLDEVTQTSQVVDFDQTRVTRSAFRNDRRVTLVGRFNF